MGYFEDLYAIEGPEKVFVNDLDYPTKPTIIIKGTM